MKLTKMAGECSGGKCPAIYLTDRDTIVVQGLKISPEEKKSIELGNNEDAIEIPKNLLKQI